MTNTDIASNTSGAPHTPPHRGGKARARRFGVATALVGAIIIGAGGATLAMKNRSPQLIAFTPAPIDSMQKGTPVAIKGQVTEIYGNKFVIQDDSGRALVETGPSGERRQLVANLEMVTVQGRLEDGFVHAVAISHADGHNDILGPPGPGPNHGPAARRERLDRPQAVEPAKQG